MTYAGFDPHQRKYYYPMPIAQIEVLQALLDEMVPGGMLSGLVLVEMRPSIERGYMVDMMDADAHFYGINTTGIETRTQLYLALGSIIQWREERQSEKAAREAQQKEPKHE